MGYEQIIRTMSYLALIGLALILMERRYSLPLSTLIGLFAAALMTAADLIRYSRPPSLLITMLVSLFQILIAQGCIMFLAKRRGWGALFTSLSVAVYNPLGGIAALITLSATNSGAAAIAVSVVVHGLVLFAAWRFGRRIFQYFQREPVFRQPWVCLAPALFYLCMFSFTTYPFDFGTTPEGAIPVVCILTAMSLSYALIFFNAKQQRELAEILRNNDILTAYAQGLTRDLTTGQKAAEQAAIARHDSRHNLRTLHGLLKAGQTDEALVALEQMDEALTELSPMVYCKNPAVNAILGEMNTTAEKAGVKLTTRLDVPESLPFPGVELASVFANLTENAIEAAAALPAKDGRPRMVRLIARQAKAGIIIEIQNPCGNDVLMDEDTGLPVSQKKSGDHGLGLRSVAAFVRRYGGMFDANVEERQFFIRIFLPFGEPEK